MSRSLAVLRNTDPLVYLNEFSHTFADLAVSLVVGLALGRLVARLMRIRGVHWSWGAVGSAILLLLCRPLSGAGPVLLIAALCATRRVRRWHREDVEAGADLVEAAARRSTPLDVLAVAWRRSVLGRRRASRSLLLRGEETVIGLDRQGRSVSIPFGGVHGGTHTLLVGATGSGKTVTQSWMVVRAIERGMGAIVLDPKGDASMRAALAEAASRAGREFVEWTPEGPSRYNPFARGSDTEIADKALAGERFTEPHYLRQAQRYLGHAVRALRAADLEISLREIVRQLDPLELELLVRGLPAEVADATHAYLDSLTTRQHADLAGARDRLSILAESDVGRWLDPDSERARDLDLLRAARERAVVYYRLDADRRPLLTQMLGAAIVQDLQTVVAALQSEPTPTVLVIDEFSALAAEHVVRLFGRARSAGFSLILGTQELSDLRLPGREHLLEQVLGNLTTLLAHRQVVVASAELIGGLAGSRGVWRTSRNGDGRITRTRTREGVLRAGDVMELGPGLVAAIVLGDGGSTRIARVFSPGQEER